MKTTLLTLVATAALGALLSARAAAARQTLSPQWQWNHNPLANAWSLRERRGWLRLHARPAAELTLARNTLTQKLWGEAGTFTVKLDAHGLSDGQRAGLAFMSGKEFSAVGVVREGEVRRFYWGATAVGGSAARSGAPAVGSGAPASGGAAVGSGSAATDLPVTAGPTVAGKTVWLRGVYEGAAARLLYSVDGTHFVDTGLAVTLKVGQWKGARVALFAYGPGGGVADFDAFEHRPDAAGPR